MNEPKKTKPTPEQQAVLDKIAKMPEKDRTRLLKLERLRRGLPTRR